MTRTVGVEEEFLVARADGAHLVPRGEPVAETADDRSDGQFEHELKREQAELGTSPHEDLAELRDDLTERRGELARSAAEHGARILALATAPTDGRGTTTPSERYERLNDRFGETARTALSCGMHVHVGIESRDEGVLALNAVRPWLPVLVALSANSPFHAGRDTGHASYRTMLWHRWPTAGPFGTFRDAADYDATVQALVDSGAALDHAGLYLDVRLSASYPTLEIRVADVCPWPDDAVALAGLCRALVDGAVGGALPAATAVSARVELVRAASWRAARYGAAGELWHPVSDSLVPAWELVGELAAALDLPAPVRRGLERLRARGTGSELQRAVYERAGSFDAVVDAVAEATVSG